MLLSIKLPVHAHLENIQNGNTLNHMVWVVVQMKQMLLQSREGETPQRQVVAKHKQVLLQNKVKKQQLKLHQQKKQ